MELKIKENVNLKQLLSLGFEYDNNRYEYCCEDDSYLFIDDFNRNLIIHHLANINNYTYNEPGEFIIKTPIPPIIMVLAKMDLLEII